ncbi:S-layer homology domain-containing protein [Paenibacillus sp. N3.4]|uniref:S-layer homology domain-containing protein n=1 Tax=Paenibacillus sp. N3.4 TaxID=2603222 RepID=UPI0016507F79|nr:S-layer homology domain-containing protein [Paenibacillus sp. N3.4]
MTMKKKLTVTTLAASMLFASIAGLPLSEKGLAGKLGITAGVASASSAFDQLNALKAELARDTQGAAQVAAVRDYVALNLDLLGDSKKEELAQEIVDRVHAKAPGIAASTLFDLINGLNLFYDGSSDALAALINDPTKRQVLNDLFTAAGLAGIDEANGLKKSDVVDFQNAALAALNKPENKSTLKEALVAALTGTSVDSQVIKNAVNTIVKKDVITSDTLLISKLLDYYKISLNDLDAVQNRIANYINDDTNSTVDAKTARTALESAAVRYLLKDDIVYAATASTLSSVTPGLKVFGFLVPNTFITWSAQDPSISYNGNSFVLNSTTSGSSVVQAKDFKFGMLLYISPSKITLSTESSSNVGGGGGGGGVQSVADKAISELTNLFKDFAGATEEKKQEILKDAQDKANTAITKLSTLDLASIVTTDNGTAKPNLDVTGLVAKVKDIVDQTKLINDKLVALNSSLKTEKVQLTLDFGTISAKTTEIPFPKDLLAAAVAGRIEKVAVGLNGLTLSVNPSEFSSDTTLKVTNQDATVASSITKLALASGVYEFEFTSGGNKVGSFNTPVEVKIPIPNGTQFDTELLSLAKIVDGKLEFYGGKYTNGVLTGVRNSFSTYTVVENQVSFGDTASVKAWAGRQIQVAAAKGILEGRGEQKFDPNGLVTRAEFAKLIVKTFNLENASATQSFDDVNDSDWFKPYVASAVKSGIVNGKTATTFDPNGQITRAEMAVMSSRALALKGASLEVTKIDDVLKGFKDVGTINASLKNGVALAASQGIIVGEEGDLFNPNANSTRAQAAVVIYRLLNK